MSDLREDDCAAGLALVASARAKKIARLCSQQDAFMQACTGHDEPRLWRLTWAEDLLEDLWHRRNPAEDEDPDGMAEAYGRTRKLFGLLRDAINQAEGKEEDDAL